MARLRAVLWLLWLAVLACAHWVVCWAPRDVPLFPIEWEEWLMARARYAHGRCRAANLQAFWDRWNRSM